jgi:CRP/FNR family transcriptional regulator
MQNGEETARLLARVPLFAGLTDDQLAGIASVAVPRTWKAGEQVFREGDQGDTAYLIRSGSVRITRQHSGGRVITLVEMRPGDMFGELAMFVDEKRSASVEAIEDTTGLAFLAGDLKRLLLGNPEMALRMMENLAHRVRTANERISRQSFQTVAGRVASVLLQQAEQRQRDGGPEQDVLIPSTRAEIAQLAGSSRESVSRFLASLERAGVVTCGRGKVVVHDPRSLRSYIY